MSVCAPMFFCVYVSYSVCVGVWYVCVNVFDVCMCAHVCRMCVHVWLLHLCICVYTCVLIFAHLWHVCDVLLGGMCIVCVSVFMCMYTHL